MVHKRPPHDLDLLDALEALPTAAFSGDIWRIVRQGRDPLQGYPSAGRWDPGRFDVLYTALARKGALAEVYFHLSRQPVFPSKLNSILHRITVTTRHTLRLADMAALAALGVDIGTYAGLDYTRTQTIADAAAFLGFDGIIAPSARWDGSNLILFLDRFGPGDLMVAEQEPVDWAAWRATVTRPS